MVGIAHEAFGLLDQVRDHDDRLVVGVGETHIGTFDDEQYHHKGKAAGMSRGFC